jgi:hypothetical protein
MGYNGMGMNKAAGKENAYDGLQQATPCLRVTYTQTAS